MKDTIKTLLFLAAVFLFFLLLFGFEDLDRAIPLLPPIIAIGFAFLTQNVIFALFCGIFVGALATVDITGVGSFLTGLIIGVVRVGDPYILEGLRDRSHAANVIFLITISGMIGIVTRSGGFEDIVQKVSRVCKNATRCQFFTWLAGLVFFVDDYANTLVVGHTMRPLTDRHRVSREKLSFIVDATAAPVASLFFVSTWIGYEVGLIADAVKKAGFNDKAYLLFLDSIPYRFYAFLLLAFILLSAFLRRDFGPMLKAERRARRTGKVIRDDSTPLTSKELTEMELNPSVPKRWYNAAIPLLVLVGSVFLGLYLDGMAKLVETLGATKAAAASLREIVGEADSFTVLLCASILSTISAIVLVVAQRICTLKEAIDAWIDGGKALVIAIVILCMAWALAGVIDDLNTAEVIANLTSGVLKPAMLPLITFLLSSFIAFATGTSWGTMAILFPLVIPLLSQLLAVDGTPIADVHYLLTGTVGAILTGAIFGDHISPISDTTVMSSMCSAVDHMDHVRTQMPYAIVVGIIAAAFGYLPAGFGINPWLLMLVGVVLIWLVLVRFGKNPEVE